MSFKRIAVLCTVALGAVALVGGGYAAAQSKGSSTTLITSPAAGTPSQAYGGASTSQLSPAGVQLLADSYNANCSSTVNGSAVTVTVTAAGAPGAPAPTGNVTFTRQPHRQRSQAIGRWVRDARFRVLSQVARPVDTRYPGDGNNYGDCGGSVGVPEDRFATTCTVNRAGNDATIVLKRTSTGELLSGQPVTFSKTGTTSETKNTDVNGFQTKGYGSGGAAKGVTVSYDGNATYAPCSGTTS